MRPLSSTLTVVLGGCRQADGPVPGTNETYQEELWTSRAICRTWPPGATRMAPPILPLICVSDTEKPAARPLVDELSARTVLHHGESLQRSGMQRLAHNLWVSWCMKDLSERQIETLQNDMQAHLVSLGWARIVPSR